MQVQIPQTAQAVIASNSLYTLSYIHSVYIAKPPPTPTKIFDPFLWLTLPSPTEQAVPPGTASGLPPGCPAMAACTVYGGKGGGAWWEGCIFSSESASSTAQGKSSLNGQPFVGPTQTPPLRYQFLVNKT